jgi:DNA polymerase-3 subunit beta
MKLSVSQDKLARSLAVVGRAVATRSTLPITTHVLLKASNSSLELSATNLEISISCRIDAEVTSEGSIAVPARLLTEFVTSLQPDLMSMELSNATKQLELSSGRVTAKLTGQSADDFPVTPNLEEGISLEIPAEKLRLCIERVSFAAATDDARPVLTGIHTAFSDKEMTMAAADGFRLAVQKIDLSETVDQNVDLIIPARSLREVDRLLAEQEDPVSIMISPAKNQILFRLKETEIISQLLQGTFPNYNQLIPESYQTKATIEVSDFLRATRTAAVFARDGNGIVRLYVNPGEGDQAGTVRLAARSDEVGENEADIDAIIEGEQSQIAFNSRYLVDVLSSLNGKVTLETSSPSSPGTIKPVINDTGDYLHVVMPMFVQW